MSQKTFIHTVVPVGMWQHVQKQQHTLKKAAVWDLLAYRTNNIAYAQCTALHDAGISEAQNTNCQAKSSKSSKRELCERSTGATACLPSETTGLGAVLLGLALPQFYCDRACVGTAFPSPNCLLSTIIAIFEIFLLAYLWGFS